MDLIWDGIRQAFGILAHGRNDVWGITMRSLLISGTASIGPNGETYYELSPAAPERAE